MTSCSQIAEAEKLEYDPDDHDGTSSTLAPRGNIPDFPRVRCRRLERGYSRIGTLVPSAALTFVARSTQRTNFPAREIYERLLPSVVSELCDTFYWPGSPFGGTSTRDVTAGDIHQWDVWHGVRSESCSLTKFQDSISYNAPFSAGSSSISRLRQAERSFRFRIWHVSAVSTRRSVRGLADVFSTRYRDGSCARSANDQVLPGRRRD